MAKASLVIDIWTRDKDDALPDNLDEVFQSHVDHVEHLLRDGFTSGEIVDDDFRGWWKIMPEGREGA